MEHQAAMELGYSLDMGLAKNLLVQQPCHNVIPSQQYYYEYSTAPAQNYLSVPPLTIQCTNGQPFYDFGAASNQPHFELAAVSSQTGCQLGFPSPAYTGATTFPSTQSIAEPYVGGCTLESSVFLSPQTSAPSSAAQSPQSTTQEPAGELWDLTNLDDILDGDGILSEDVLFDVLADVGGTDFLSQLDSVSSPLGELESCFTPSHSGSSSSSSVASTPKRKYSTDSSDCYSVDSFDACSSVASLASLAKPTKRARRAKPTKEEKAARKKDQNKKAASRYRNKKKTEVKSSELTLEELESHRDSLASELKKLQTEFGVILPLAKAAFAFDPVRNQHLTQLMARVNALI